MITEITAALESIDFTQVSGILMKSLDHVKLITGSLTELSESDLLFTECDCRTHFVYYHLILVHMRVIIKSPLDDTSRVHTHSLLEIMVIWWLNFQWWYFNGTAYFHTEVTIKLGIYVEFYLLSLCRFAYLGLEFALFLWYGDALKCISGTIDENRF